MNYYYKDYFRGDFSYSFYFFIVVIVIFLLVFVYIKYDCNEIGNDNE